MMLSATGLAQMISIDLERIPKQIQPDIDAYHPSGYIDVSQTGWTYQAPAFFGSGKNEAKMTFDMGSSYTTVTADTCSNCNSKAYKPGTSDSEVNLGSPYQLDID